MAMPPLGSAAAAAAAGRLRGWGSSASSTSTAAMQSIYDEIVGTSNDRGSAVGVYDEFSDVIPARQGGMTMSDVQALDSERESRLEEQNGEFSVALPPSQDQRR